MQPGEQHHHGVDQPVDGVLADSTAEQGPVRQRELQVIGDQDGIEWLAGGVQRSVTTPTASTEGVSRRVIAEQPILVDGEMLEHFLHRVDIVADPHERTTWREMPRGSATSMSSGHSASGVSQGRVSSRVSGLAEENLGTGLSCQTRIGPPQRDVEGPSFCVRRSG